MRPKITLVYLCASPKSLYFKGWASQFAQGPNGLQLDKMDVEGYFEPGQRYWSLQYANSGQGFERRYSASDGVRYIEVNDARKTVIMGREIPLQTLLRTSQFPSLLLSGPAADLSAYKKVRQEKVGQVSTDVYERLLTQGDGRPAIKFAVWLDPAMGLPVRVAYWMVDGEQQQLMGEFTDFVANGPPKPGMFDFAPPAGYEVTQADRKAEEVGVRAYSDSQTPEGNAYCVVRFGLNIQGHAFLVCWAHYEKPKDGGPLREADIPNQAGDRVDLPGLNIGGSIPFDHYYLAAHKAPGQDFHWRWSLLVSKDRAVKVANDLPRMEFKLKDLTGRSGASTTVTLEPIELRRATLSKVLVEAQRITMDPQDPSGKVYSLEEIERIIEGLRNKD